MIEKFLEDKQHHNMFLTGGAGTGKTTTTKEYVDYLFAHQITFLITSYTHKAKEVLKDKMPMYAEDCVTLHSFLKKRPSINAKATNSKHVMISRQYGQPEPLQVLFIDEFSFVGTKDANSIADLQESSMFYVCSKCLKHFTDSDIDENEYNCPDCKHKYNLLDSIEEVYNDNPQHCKDFGLVPFVPLKVIYIGDPNQLNPVNDVQGIVPHEPFHKHLTKVWRIASDSDLGDTTVRLADMVASGDNDLSWIKPTNDLAIEHDREVFINKIVYAINDNTNNVRCMAYTNKLVERMNKDVHLALHGYDEPKIGDTISLVTLRLEGKIKQWDIMPNYATKVITQTGELTKATKYNPMRTIDTLNDKLNANIVYVLVELPHDEDITVAIVFGMSKYQTFKKTLEERLTALNRGSRDSKTMYKYLKTYTDYIVQADFPYATTIHKVQGDEFKEVFIDWDSLLNAFNRQDAVRLASVAVSRATHKVTLLTKD